MPTTYTHYKHGLEVLNKIQSKHFFNLEYLDLFNIGVHGPDIVFYYHFYNPKDKNKVGYDMHHILGKDLFKSFKEIYLHHPNKDKALAYLCGFICHFALDSTMHSIVYKYQTSHGFTHSIIETQLDRTLLIQSGIKRPETYHLCQHIHPNMDNASVIAMFFDSFTPEMIFKSLNSQIYIHECLRCTSKTKYQLVTKTLNISKNKFFRDLVMMHSDKKELHKCINELLSYWDFAIEKAAICIENFIDYIHSRGELNEYFNHDFE